MFLNYAYAAEVAEDVTEVASNLSGESFQEIFMRFVPMLLIFMVFYFLILRPQSKKRQEHEELIKGIQKGQEVLTHSGIYGKVVKANQEVLEIEIAPKVIIKMDRSAVNQVINKE